MSTESKEQLRAVTAAVPEAKTALTKMAIALWAVLATALANFLSAAAPELANLVLQFVPTWLQGTIAPLATTAVLAIVAYLQRSASNNTKTAIVDAVETSPDDVRALYGK